MNRTVRFLTTAAILLALLVGIVAATQTQTASAAPVYTCLPTCSAVDARFFTVSGAGLETLADESIHLQVASPGDAGSVEIGIFDGDTSGLWDFKSTFLQFNLYADAQLEGATDVLVDQWSGSGMSDNTWFSATVTNHPDALAPSGNYFYHLEIKPVVLGTTYTNNFKVRTDGVLLTVRPSVFAFMAGALSVPELTLIYPNLPSLSGSYYDGNFTLYFYLPQSTNSFSTWDGDLDHGSFDGTNQDTDDPDTPNDVLPAWALGTSARYEGVAIGSAGTTSNPNDDNSIAVFRRSPSVFYTVTDPAGQVYTNTNPSGNMEWEQFLIETDTSKPADAYATSLPAGVYKVTLQGMDLANLNAWRTLYGVVGVCEDNSPCKPVLHPYTIGDTVFEDLDGNGVQDPNEPGLPGVTVTLLDGNGNPVLDINGQPITTITGLNGEYFFEVDGQSIDPVTGEIILDGVYTVQVAASNFDPGGALFGMTSTTGGEEQTDTVIDQNVLTYDFGYQRPVAPGTGTIGYWMTHPQAWPVSSITIGGRSYTREQAIAIMQKPGKGDKTYDLFAQLVAAKLNVIVGNEASCIAADIAAADAWMATYPVGSKVKASSAAWQSISAVFTRLDAYNNGLLCAPHRD